jgi:GH25 family lysozyme M1 (1,4-beta-N-acetylmuramidase)
VTLPTASQLTAAAASAAPVQSAQGLDVSNFQGRFPWAKTTGLSFGIHRLTQGLSTSGTNSPDPTAQWNHAEIGKRGLHRGAYHFLDPREPGAAQARQFVNALDSLGMTLADMLWLDNENPSNPGPAATAACAREFMAELDKLVPHNPRGVYTFLSYAAAGNCAGLGHYPVWIAHPAATAPAAPPPWGSWKFWQWGTRNGDDADAFNGTAAGLDAWIRSFAPPPPAASGPAPHVTAGLSSLAGLAAQHKTDPSVILRLTLEHSPGGVFPADVAGFLNAVLAGTVPVLAHMPAGLRLWLPGSTA